VQYLDLALFAGLTAQALCTDHRQVLASWGRSTMRFNRENLVHGKFLVVFDVAVFNAFFLMPFFASRDAYSNGPREMGIDWTASATLL
jgi:hypothetical protein